MLCGYVGNWGGWSIMWCFLGKCTWIGIMGFLGLGFISALMFLSHLFSILVFLIFYIQFILIAKWCKWSFYLRITFIFIALIHRNIWYKSFLFPEFPELRKLWRLSQLLRKMIPGWIDNLLIIANFPQLIKWIIKWIDLYQRLIFIK
jgi:hypothetical protein